MTLAPMPSPATRKMMPAAVSGSSWHWMTVMLESLPRRSVAKMPAPGMPRDTVFTLPEEEEDIPAGMAERWFLAFFFLFFSLSLLVFLLQQTAAVRGLRVASGGRCGNDG